MTDYANFYKLDIIDAFISLLVLPLMYFYFRSLTNEVKFDWKDYIWLIPAIIIGTGTLLLYLVMGEENAINYTTLRMTNQPLPVEYKTTLYKLHFLISVRLYDATVIIQSIIVSIYAIVSILQYHRRLKDFYSVTDDKSIELDHAVLRWFMFSLLFALIFIFTGRPFWEKHSVWFILFFVGWAVVYFGLSYNGSKIKYSVEKLAEDLQQADLNITRHDYPLSGNNNETADANHTFSPDQTGKYVRLFSSFNKLITENKIFLKNDLRADEVARLMFTNRTYISRMIKEECKCSFSDFINRKRVEHAQELMKKDPGMRLTDLAENSGFINANSFSRTFKQFTGIPPKEWLRKHILHQ